MNSTLAGLRDFTANALAAAYLQRPAVARRAAAERQGRRRGVPIWNLHRIGNTALHHTNTLPPHRFRAILEHLQQRYRFITLTELDSVLGRGENAEELLSLTFDDCYRCNYEHAVPILRELRIPATFFISSGYVDSSTSFAHDLRNGIVGLPNFTSPQLRDMADHGFEIGSHSVSHADFSREHDEATVRYELEESRRALEAMCGKPVTRFAVPWGSPDHCRPEVIRAAQAAGYERVYSHFGGRNLIDGGRLGYVLHRICSHGAPTCVQACLEGYRGRDSLVPDWRSKTAWPQQFHAVDIRRL